MSRLALLAAGVALLAPPISPIDLSAAAPVVIESPSAAWRGQVEWALARFEEAGLELDALVVSVHDDRGPCRGNAGLYLPGVVAEVRLCSPSPVGSRPARLITLHELGHAWAETHLGADDRRAFLAARRLTAWRDDRLAAHEWGAEHAAEVLSWGLMDEPIPIIRIEDAAPDQLATAFAVLAGRPPLWAGEDRRP